MKNGKLARILALTLLLAMTMGLFAACGNSNSPGESAPQSAPPSVNTESEAPGPEEIQKQTIKIGVVTAFSGPVARTGESQLAGLNVALKQIEESGYSKYYDFEVVTGDDQNDATSALSVANMLINNENIKAVFGHLNAVVTLAALSVYEESKIPCFTPSGSSPKITNSGFDYVYQCLPNDQILAHSIVNYLVETGGFKKIALLYDNSESGQANLGYVTEALAEHGLELVTAETFTTATDTDFTGQILSIKRAEADAVLIFAGDTNQRAIQIKQIRQLIGNDIQISGDYRFNDSTVYSLTTVEERAGIIYTAPWSASFTDEASAQFVEDYKTIDPAAAAIGSVTVRFYDGLYLLATALNNLGPYDVNAADFTQKLNEQIKLSSYDGLQGTLQPNDKGECVEKAHIIKMGDDGTEAVIG